MRHRGHGRWTAIRSGAQRVLLAGLVTAFALASGLTTAGASHAMTAPRDVAVTLPDGSRHILRLPSDLHVSVFVGGLSSPRFMALGPRGDIIVGSLSGDVYVLRSSAGGAARVLPLLQGLDTPHGVAYRNGLLYVAEQGQVSVMRYDPVRVVVTDRRVLIPGLPAGSGHVTRTIVPGPDGLLYLSIGSSCNVCIESDPRRAAITRYRLDGTDVGRYAYGLRNAVGLAWQPGTGLLWATSNGRDYLGDNNPPDLVTIVRPGADYGWPYCWGNRQPDPDVRPVAGYCARMTLPTVAIQAHSAPLGLAFYTGRLLPARYRGGLFVAYHGSWNRSAPTGYKLVYIPVQGTRAGPPRDVVTGWLAGGGVWGRPVGVLVALDGSLLISDDKAGVIYRLT